ncbi:MFS transporter [Pilimelia columellifera]|uniref:MFS transporter n=1 Tax=Pilimelia columellifera TaxID=706574 RepID=UPI0031E31D28
MSYLASAVLLSRISATRQGRPVPSDGGFLRRIGEGLRYGRTHPVLSPCMIAATMANFANGAIIASLGPFVIRQLGLASGVFGVVFAIEGAGALLGALAASRFAARWGGARAVVRGRRRGIGGHHAQPPSDGVATRAARPRYGIGAVHLLDGHSDRINDRRRGGTGLAARRGTPHCLYRRRSNAGGAPDLARTAVARPQGR